LIVIIHRGKERTALRCLPRLAHLVLSLQDALEPVLFRAFRVLQEAQAARYQGAVVVYCACRWLYLGGVGLEGLDGDPGDQARAIQTR